MGVKRPGKKYRLVWPADEPGAPETAMSGVEVLMRGLSVRKLLEVQRLAKAGLKDTDGVVRDEAVERLFELVAENVVEWNLEEDDGEPVAHDVDGVMSLEADPLLEIVSEWVDAMASVAPPLSRNSSAGEPSEEQWGPMEAIPPESRPS